MAQDSPWTGKYEVKASSSQIVGVKDELEIYIHNKLLTGIIKKHNSSDTIPVRDLDQHDPGNTEPWRAEISQNHRLFLCKSTSSTPPPSYRFIIGKEEAKPTDVWVAEDHGDDPPG